MRLFVFAVFCYLFSFSFVKAQTVLAPGDILFTSYNAVPSSGSAPDTFSFIILAPVTTGTIIYFTERGYQGGTTWQASGSTEGTISWTAGSALAIGKEVTIAGIGASAAKVDGSVNGTVAIVSGGNATTGLSLSNAGDQLLAFQGASGDPTNGSAVFITGISWALSCGTTTDAGWNGSGCTYGPQSSQLPAGLTGGSTALLMGTAGSSPNNSHGRYNCTGTPITTVAAIKASILHKANWQFSSSVSTTFDVPSECNYAGSALPVTWLEVKAVLANKQTILTWKVNEYDVANYEIERSADGILFSNLKTIQSKGNGEKTYQYSVPSYSTAIHYYRIKQIDLNRFFTYSQVVKIHNPQTHQISIYPLPAKNSVTIEVNKSLLNTIVQLLNSNGITEQSFMLLQTPFVLNLADKAPGIYLLRFADGQVKKIIKE